MAAITGVGPLAQHQMSVSVDDFESAGLSVRFRALDITDEDGSFPEPSSKVAKVAIHNLLGLFNADPDAPTRSQYAKQIATALDFDLDNPSEEALIYKLAQTTDRSCHDMAIDIWNLLPAEKKSAVADKLAVLSRAHAPHTIIKMCKRGFIPSDSLLVEIATAPLPNPAQRLLHLDKLINYLKKITSVTTQPRTVTPTALEKLFESWIEAA